MNGRLLEPAVWHGVQPYLDQVLDLPVDDREGWLAALDQTEPTIARLVRELLAEYEGLTTKGPFDQSALSAFNLSSLTGQRIGAYTVEHLLGRGGMGEVWLASRHDGRFEGRCAIKLLDDTLSKANLADRFRREAHLLARLTHPHIARLIDAGSTEDGRQYLALEYVDGERIDHYCQSCSLTPQARVRLFLDVISAVTHAHANLVIHRDLKPSNVLVTHAGVVKLLDFGIAKLIREEPVEEDPSATRVEEIVLTPDYAAPEQILGATPSTATDVYQLGMLLYVLLIGRHPLPRTTNRADLAKTVLGKNLPRASELASGSLQKALRGDLDAILSMALQKNPPDRYPSAAAFGEDLRRYLNREPVTARRGGTLYVARKFIRRHRLAVAGTALAAAGLFATAVFALAQAREAAHQRDQAQMEAKRADAQNRFLILTMAAIGEPGKPVTQQWILANSEKLLDTHYGNDPEFVVDMLIDIASRYMDFGDFERGYATLRKAEGIARRHGDLLRLAHVQCGTVELDAMRGDVERAAERLAEGQSALARSPKRTLNDEVECLQAAAVVSLARGKMLDAIRLVEQGVTQLEQQQLVQDSSYTWLVSYLFTLYSNVGDTRKGFEAARKHRQAEEHNYGTDTVRLLGAMHNEACALRDLGEIGAALTEQTQVVQRAGAAGSEADIHQAMSGVYASLLLRRGQPESALLWFERTIATAERSGDDENAAAAQVGRARALYALHRDAEADEALDAADRVAKGDQQKRGSLPGVALLRAELLASRGNLIEALTVIETLLKQLRDGNSGQGRYLDDALLAASRIVLAQGRVAPAEAYAREALQISESRARDPAQSADVGEATLVLAQIRARSDAGNEARTLASRAAISLKNGLGPDHSLTRAALALADQVRSGAGLIEASATTRH